MLKIVRLILCSISIATFNFFLSEVSLSQAIGIKECDLGRVSLIKSKIYKASLKPSSKGYLLELEDGDGKQVFGLTKQLSYYYDSSGQFILENTAPAQIAPDGSFILILPITARNGCIYKGKLMFENGSKEQLFSQTDPCQLALIKSKLKIDNANIRIDDLSKQKHEYKNYPTGRRLEYAFSMHGPGLTSFLSSNVLLTSLSANIISSCKDVGLVTFGRSQTDEFITYGLMQNGKVQAFKCVPADRRRERQTTPTWGYTVCL